MSTHRICPMCGGPMQTVIEPRAIKVGRWSATVDDEFMRCESCGEEAYLAGQMRATQERAARVIREREKIMSPERVRGFRERYGLSQSQLERLLNVGAKTVVRWERGTVMPGAAINTLLRILDEMPPAVAALAVENGVILSGGGVPCAFRVQVHRASTLSASVPKTTAPAYKPGLAMQPGAQLPAAIASRLNGVSAELSETIGSKGCFA